jgi:Zn-finger nucleic acid-binding protein
MFTPPRSLTMQCPVCKTSSLSMTERSGIEIDYCPQCRGVWLDRGELDKIIERASPAPQRAAPAPQSMPPPVHAPAPYGGGGYYKKKKREGFLGELFDFD